MGEKAIKVCIYRKKTIALFSLLIGLITRLFHYDFKINSLGSIGLIANSQAEITGCSPDYNYHPLEIETIGQAKDVGETIDSFEELKPDAVILDNQMPGESGIDVLKHIKKEQPATVLACRLKFNDKEMMSSVKNTGG